MLSPFLPREIHALILSNIELSYHTDTLVSCCLVSKGFRSLALPILYSDEQIYFSIGDQDHDENRPATVVLDPGYTRRALVVSRWPYLAVHRRAISIEVEVPPGSLMDSNLLPLAISNSLRTSPAIHHLALNVACTAEQEGGFLKPLFEVVVPYGPSLRSLVFRSQELLLPPALLAPFLHSLPSLTLLHLERFSFADTSSPPRFHLKKLNLGVDTSKDSSSTLPYLTRHSFESLHHLALGRINGQSPPDRQHLSYDLSRLTSLLTLFVDMKANSNLDVLGSLNAPNLYSICIIALPTLTRWSHGTPKVKTESGLMAAGVLEKIPRHVKTVKLGGEIKLEYLSSFLAKNASRLSWRRVEALCPKEERTTIKELGGMNRIVFECKHVRR